LVDDHWPFFINCVSVRPDVLASVVQPCLPKDVNVNSGRRPAAEVNRAIIRRAQRLVEMGLATAKDGNIRVPVHTVTTLQRQEVDRVGQQMAADRGLTFVPTSAGEYVSGRLAGVASQVSGRFAMIENGLGFQLVPWQALLEKRIGQHIAGLQRDDGGIEWTLGGNRGLSL
jgi:hypothetical protein